MWRGGQLCRRDGWNGRLLRNIRSTRRSLVWVDCRGREEPFGNQRGAFRQVSLSPDGSRLAVEVEFAEGVSRSAIWLYHLKTGAFNRMTFDNLAEFPVWSPDGSRLAFSQGGDNRGIYWQMADASQSAERLFATGNELGRGSWARMGGGSSTWKPAPTRAATSESLTSAAMPGP